MTPTILTRFWPAAACCAALLAGCGKSPEPGGAARPAEGPLSAASPAGGIRLYVSDETGGHVVVVDPDAGKLVARVAVGKRPRGIALSTDQTQLFVALSGSPIGGPGVDESKLPPADRTADGIGVVDLASGRLVRKFRSGVDPEAFAVSPDGRALYVSNEDSSEMSVIDIGSGDVRTHVQVGLEPEGVAVRPGGKEIYVSCEASNQVYVVDAASNAVVARLTTAARPRATAFTTDGATAYVTNENGGAVTVVDANARRVTGTIVIPRVQGQQIPPRPMGAVFSADERTLFVSLGRAKSIAAISVADQQVDHIIENVGARPWGITISADGRRLYTANGPSGDVSAVDIASGTVTSRIAVGGSPWGVALSRTR